MLRIKQASPEDLQAIKQWLEQERQESGEGFSCNWGVIEKSFDDLWVMNDEEIVGFLVKGPCGPDILEIHPGCRGRGNGRKLVEWVIDQYYMDGCSVIEVQCSPETSEPFWRKMGFVIYDNRQSGMPRRCGYKLLERKFDMPQGETVPFRICFYPREADWDQSIPAFAVYEGNGIAERGVISLPQRAVCYREGYGSCMDYVVSIEVNGKMIFRDKVKRDEAKACGVYRGKDYVYYIDKINASSI